MAGLAKPGSEPDFAPRSRAHDYAGLAVFVVLSAAVSALGGWVTAGSVGTWYQALAKPPFNPPNWIFGPVWTALYVMIAIAGWRVWRVSRRAPGREVRLALTLYAVQLLLNLVWSFVFFGAHRIGAALAEIVVLLAAILVTMVLFWRIERAAGMLFVPYAAWVAFATALNAALWLLN